MARKRNQGSKWIRPHKRTALYTRDRWTCVYCAGDVTPGNAEGKYATLDHVVACENGGTNQASNLVTACHTCNSRKLDKSMRSFFKYLRNKRGHTHEQTSVIGRRVRQAVARNWKHHYARIVQEVAEAELARG